LRRTRLDQDFAPVLVQGGKITVIGVAVVFPNVLRPHVAAVETRDRLSTGCNWGFHKAPRQFSKPVVGLARPSLTSSLEALSASLTGREGWVRVRFTSEGGPIGERLGSGS
jgi:hypothetical protein